jgi:hypothetical protein
MRGSRRWGTRRHHKSASDPHAWAGPAADQPGEPRGQALRPRSGSRQGGLGQEPGAGPSLQFGRGGWRKGVCSDVESVRAVVRRGGKSRIDLADRSGVDVPDLKPEGTGSFRRQFAQINSTWYESSVPRRIRLLTHVRQTSLS